MESKVQYYEKKLKEMLSNDDFSKYLKDAPENLITYKELNNFKSMAELLEKEYRIYLKKKKEKRS
jgi:hypothetical protein